MIDVRQASEAALSHLKSLYPSYDLGNVLLEEAELTDDEKFWLITLSFRAPGKSASDFFGEPRDLKIIKISADTGDLKSMKIRKV